MTSSVWPLVRSCCKTSQLKEKKKKGQLKEKYTERFREILQSKESKSMEKPFLLFWRQPVYSRNKSSGS